MALVAVYPHRLKEVSRPKVEAQVLRVLAVWPSLARPTGRGPLIDREFGRERVVRAAVRLGLTVVVLVRLLLVAPVPGLHHPVLASDLPPLRRVLVVQAPFGPLARVS